MNRVFSFPPVTAPQTRVLILGSMPGEKSLQMGQYYAHPQNAFWKIMGALIGAGRELDYAERLERLLAHGLGMWEVLMSCHRIGSLDSSIVQETMEPNDFNAFYAAHPMVTHVFFNGGMAAAAYKRYVQPGLSPEFAYVQYERLPSTSPAHASLKFEQKLDVWKKILLC
ncbi:MAG TPA: DNA-deoxyinosine glycosylase [Methylophilaceae bacterium]|nr:DNA-deoxyinosine glycosylase [Methylophilaceae bacterium]